MATLKLFYNAANSDSVSLKTFFDQITANDDVVVNGNEPLNTKATFISYDLDLADNHPGKTDYVGEGVSSPLLRVESTLSTDWVGNSSGSNNSISEDSVANTKAGMAEDITTLSGLDNADVLFEIITNSDQ
tara:strand:- start:62 stop:454 length:393 start_codon:yes stop_codon:yes gene_type:complete